MKKEIIQSLEDSIQVKRAIVSNKTDTIETIIGIIVSSIKSGGKVVLFGNGGSAADAQHIACELVGKFMIERQALPAIALTTNTSILTAIGNDSGYDMIFSRQVEALVNEGDVILAFSTSGDSDNVIEAVKTAKLKKAYTIGFTGSSGGKLAEIVDTLLNVPSNITPRIQEAHITIGHIICEMIEKVLAEDGN
ncbi:MAG: D-sedoheptulose 7-phosphate isomerase [Dehalococcoidales bacterium]|nr:D-sedoheptulose 7-phosphate isomerase [Dehalococcoidales bacterium]